VTVDGCIVKAPCGGEAAGKSPVDRGKQGTKRSLLTDRGGIPLGCVVAPANRHDSPLLRPTLETLGRFEFCFGLGLPADITVHLDAGYDSIKTRELLDELGCHSVISKKGTPLQAGARWVVERTNSWHNRGFRKLAICASRQHLWVSQRGTLTPSRGGGLRWVVGSTGPPQVIHWGQRNVGVLASPRTPHRRWRAGTTSAAVGGQ